MKIKKRKLFERELKLWKQVTKNDKKFIPYIKEEDTTRKETSFIKTINNNPVTTTQEIIKDINKSQPIRNPNHIFQANRKTISKLERGKLKPEAFIDLHGFSKTEARLEVFKFIKNSVNNEYRCVLIITGKKNTYTGAKGIIRKFLPEWLKEIEISNYILGHNYARIKDGADGARYVLLRKKNRVFGDEKSS